MRQAKTIWITAFGGLQDTLTPGQGLLSTQDPGGTQGVSGAKSLTPNLSNVRARFGNVIGRGGMTKYQAISTAASPSPILGLFNYRRTSETHQLIRLLTNHAEEFSAGAWNSISTGTPLTGTSTTRPQYDIIDDKLVFTDEGHDLPQKYTGTGVHSVISTASTPPYSKAIKAYMGFLFLINYSTNGTFTDVVNGSRSAAYSDDWENSWSICAPNTITLNETPGSWIAAEVLGRSMWCFKTDAIERVTWIGGSVRFNQELAPVRVGCIAPLSIAKVQESGIVFLGTDGLLYLIDQSGAKPISIGSLNNTLSSTVQGLNKLQYARAVVDGFNDTYYLFYDATGLSGQLLNSYVSWNFRTGEFGRGSLGQQVIASTPFKATEFVNELPLVGTQTLVETFDSGKDDDGTAFTRLWTSGWQQIPEQGWLHGIRLIFAKAVNARVKVSVARDFSQRFEYEQTFPLTGGLADDQHAEVQYHFPPIWSSWVNVQVKLYHDSATATTVLERLGLEVNPLLPTSERVVRQTTVGIV